MKERLITRGEFANLAITTKRTLAYYDEIGILKPFFVNEKGYKFYRQRQILDFQIILLLSSLNFKLDEIQSFIRGNKNLKDLFFKNRSKIQDEIEKNAYILRKITQYFENIKNNKTMVSPIFKRRKHFKYYYFEVKDAYANIGNLCNKLIDSFSSPPKQIKTLTIFLSKGYQPKKSKMRICLLKNENLKIKNKFKNKIFEAVFPSHTALTWMHNGSGNTLSLFWIEVEKYMRLYKIKRNFDLPTFEIYHTVSSKEWEQFFEINIPVIF